ncbi:hypothetical protein CcaverHIS002_0104080 [Cutaneotrichosporon cavernicola]|uniref:TATA-binding protein interacting (TIP20) domain-containing protein n=1 Tax=Cutaneotrichosporon cavernicola TaxID=279322 RepID=A0AA48L1X9_9TREE|nr:uncharacterized protein CcaverHIS019_0104010 [Cutaneotrichosporon cavernicola]BEI79879.1 hypothetical protein CcaverHIS002_0104080 [Cutaneotrichosporon cavernicola]BEI87683.1 hypothetical protein CcaverHIS019_0104010 [Cutaneotrichosporon cavernicola]BEI95455.1 hypothetical protein CcaverHIS631_0104040 [Cutaneotrichosporon cavernicola]BEJ03229.1 hypothetical protein CcaverHIS641_0104040 [Cutaneotrichosporon cavernicola]
MATRQALTSMLQSLQDKFKSTDLDLRVIGLTDLSKELERIIALNNASSRQSGKGPEPYAAEAAEKALTENVLTLLYDEISEVKNAAVRSLATMASRARSTFLRQIIITLTDGIDQTGAREINEENRDISCLALKSVVASMSPDGDAVDRCLNMILTTIRKNVTPTNANPQLASELLQILTDVYQRFPLAIAQSNDLQALSVEMLKEVFAYPRLSVRKRAVAPLAAFISVCPTQFNAFQDDMSKGFTKGGDSAKAWVAAVAGLAKTPSSPEVGGLVANGLAEIIMKQTQDLEDTDAVEGALTALEVLLSRCPKEMSTAVSPILVRSLELVKYDPNYVDFDDNDDVDMDDDAFDDDDDEFDQGEYTDDEDDSWKIRRGAAKVLEALINTRSDLLAEFYRIAALPLIARFSEREESVRLEVLEAFEALLRQTVNTRPNDRNGGSPNKRKRTGTEGMDQDDENSPLAALQEIRPQLVQATLKQANAKTVNARQQSFILLRGLVEALEGGLDNEADSICSSSAAALRSSDSTTSSFTIAVLTFLTSFFNHHVGRSYASHLDQLTKLVVRCMRDKQQRVNFEAFATASALTGSIRPLHRGSASPLRPGFEGPVKEIFQATTSVLGDNSVDGDVREKALITLGDLLLHEGDALSDRLGEALPLISARLDSENTAATAVEVAGQVAASPLCSGPAFNRWLLDILTRVIIYIRRNKSSVSKANEFTTIQSILSRLGQSLPEVVASDVVVELTPFLDQASALEIIASVLTNQPATRATVEKHVLPQVLTAIKTASNAASIDALVEFFGAYIDGDIDCSLRLVPQLVFNVTKDKSLAGTSFGGTLAYSTTAKCVGAVVTHSERNLAGILATFENTLKSSRGAGAEVYLALLCVGEIGRLNDLCANGELLQRALRFFRSDNEEIRSAAAFAAGNMAVGAPDTYVPVLVQDIENATDQGARLLLLYSLKEVIMHSSTGQLEKLADLFWQPLFAHETAPDDDGIRNIKAACIGKLTIADSARLVPQLQNMLSGDAQQRALLAASLRYTFIDTSAAYTEMIAPLVGDFLSLMNDDEPVVRRLAVAALNAAAQNKPSLISDKLNTLQPFLYRETEIREELQRYVQMGPWKVLEDDGLENRKTAYETMYTLLATSFAKIDLPSFTDRVLAALRDVNEIKVLGLMLLLRLAELAPAIVEPHLDGVVDALKAIMKDLEVKEDTIKQDLQRKEEIQRSTMRTITPMFRMTSAAQAPAFHAYVASLLKTDQWKEFREYQG